MKKIMVVFGTRPEAIKMCPLIIELKKRKNFLVYVCVTGQHKEMLQQVLNIFHITPDYDLDIMKENQSLFDITISILTKISVVLDNVKPDIVLVHGDTTTAYATSVAAFYKKIKIGHVEAGLRTNNIFSPYPEEFNRQSISLLADYNFCPTKLAKSNLLKEGKNPKTIFVTGNTVIDSFEYTVKENFIHDELKWASDSKLIFITAHRRENLGKPMENMFRAIKRVLNENPDCKAVYPIHLNPSIKKVAKKEFADISSIHLIDPIDVVTCHNFESKCFLCLTDSGGIQEECPYFGKPVLVMRDTTERPEGIKAGVLKLVGTDEETIYNEFSKLLHNYEYYTKMSKAVNPYGDGKASSRICDVLEFGNCKEYIMEN